MAAMSAACCGDRVRRSGRLVRRELAVGAAEILAVRRRWLGPNRGRNPRESTSWARPLQWGLSSQDYDKRSEAGGQWGLPGVGESARYGRGGWRRGRRRSSEGRFCSSSRRNLRRGRCIAARWVGVLVELHAVLATGPGRDGTVAEVEHASHDRGRDQAIALVDALASDENGSVGIEVARARHRGPGRPSRRSVAPRMDDLILGGRCDDRTIRPSAGRPGPTRRCESPRRRRSSRRLPCSNHRPATLGTARRWSRSCRRRRRE